jgi:hypothetical protein
VNSLRLVTDDIDGPLERDDAIATIEGHWKAARKAYVAALGQVGEHYLRQLVAPPDRGITRWHMAAIRDQARLFATSVNQMADELDRAVEVYSRAKAMSGNGNKPKPPIDGRPHPKPPPSKPIPPPQKPTGKQI